MDQTAQTLEAELREVARLLVTPDFTALRETLTASATKLQQPMQLAIIGKISSSKSTLVNAILGQKNVAATGHMEVTWNVGWLRYGKPDSDVIVHYKDGTEERKSHKEWSDLSIGKLSRANGETDVKYAGRLDNIKRNVSYIELFNDAEILKQINIIDTPGLDAANTLDSKNTIDFLNQVRPDAVIMLYTKGVSDNTIQIVNDYIGLGGNLSPLNTIGIMAKIDLQWNTADKDENLLKTFQKMTANQFVRYPELKKSLFKIYPISSLMFLGGKTLPETDFRLLQRMAHIDEATMNSMLGSVDKFTAEISVRELTEDERKYLLTEYGRYALYRMYKHLRDNPENTAADLRMLLLRESGAEELMIAVHNHFGERALLIKMESLYQQLIRQCHECRDAIGRSPEKIAVLDAAERKITEAFESLIHEIKEYELLGDIYNGKIPYLSTEEVEEFRRLCGEEGYSAPERLGMDGTEDLTVKQLVDRAEERWRHWRKEVNSEFIFPDRRRNKEVIRDSFFNLYDKLCRSSYQFDQLKAFLFNK